MGSGKRFPLKVRDFYKEIRQSLDLKSPSRQTPFSRTITVPSLKEVFLLIQIWGNKEIQALQVLPTKGRRAAFYQKTKPETVCIILSEGQSFLSEIEEEAKKKKIALFLSCHSRRKCRDVVKHFFASDMSDALTISGGLVKVFGMGILIRGDSGIGKSECVLELISRRHRFISDDVTQVTRTKEGKLIGKAPSLGRHFMEVRGLGIINIKEIFGARAVCAQAEIGLIVQLEKWKEGREYDRWGLKSWTDVQIIGRKIHQIIIPVAPGRNMATLVEVACKVHMLRERGYLAPRDLTKRLDRVLSDRS